MPQIQLKNPFKENDNVRLVGHDGANEMTVISVTEYYCNCFWKQGSQAYQGRYRCDTLEHANPGNEQEAE